MRYQQDLQTALRTRHKRLTDANGDQIHDEIRLITRWLSGQPALRAILVEAESTEPWLDFAEWEEGLHTDYFGLTWPCETEAGRAALAWRLLEHISYMRPGSIPLRPYALAVSAGGEDFHTLAREFVKVIVTPLFDYLQEQVGAESSVLYVLERYVRRVEWFDREDLYARAMQDTRKTEEVYDADLRRFLFNEGINMPFSQASSASGLSDVLTGLDTDDPLVCEVKVFDAVNRSKRHLASGVHQAISYASDYSKQVAYLLIVNLSGRPLALPSDDDPKTWPPRVTIAGTRVYLITVRALPTESASKLGKPAPVTITYNDLIDPDATNEFPA